MTQLYVSLYKDMSGKGYGKMLSDVKDWLPMTYSPKTYNGHFLQVKKACFEESLRDAVIAADCHFFWCKDNIDGVTFHIPFPDKKYFFAKIQQ